MRFTGKNSLIIYTATFILKPITQPHAPFAKYTSFINEKLCITFFVELSIGKRKRIFTTYGEYDNTKKVRQSFVRESKRGELNAFGLN